MATLVRKWRRCWHRSLLARLREPDANPGSGSERAQPWLSAVYGALVAAKRRRELAQAATIVAEPSGPSRYSENPLVPVLSVGNFTFGATGKTPFVLLLTELALRYARRGRGYGDDEWRQFAAKFPTCALAIGADRLRVGQQRAQELGGRDALSCVVLDDGLQQWRIRKDLEVVMVDALHPFGNGLLLPHGSLREAPRDALARADVVVIHHADLLDSPEALKALKTTLLTHVSAGSASTASPMTAAATTGLEDVTPTNRGTQTALPVVATSRMRVKRVVRALDMRVAAAWEVEAYDSDKDDDEEVERGEVRYDDFAGKVALIVCGVGNPESVHLVVSAMACWHEVFIEAFPDHHAFSNGDLDDMKQRAADLARATQRDVVVLTTEKDFYRAEPLLLAHLATSASSCDVRVLQCELELMENAQQVRDLVCAVLDRDVQDQEQDNSRRGDAL